MKKLRLGFAGCCLMALLFSMAAFQTKAQDTNFVGTWDMAMTGGGGGQGNGPGGGEGRGGGGGAQSLTIAKDGEKFRVTHKTPRGDNTSDATVSGNTISWTEQRTGRNGETMKIDFKATLDGDTLKGTASGGDLTANLRPRDRARAAAAPRPTRSRKPTLMLRDLPGSSVA